jgi:predicted nucleic acid-binding Zn ribbon protein
MQKEINPKYLFHKTCLNCGKAINPPKKRFCSLECRELFLMEQKKAKIPPKIHKICEWCKVEYTTLFPRQVFCSNKNCAENYKKIRNRISNLYSLDPETQNRELKKLEQFGKFYTFPKEHESLNIFYQLKGEVKTE